jgi:hypothetical protein
MPLPKISTPKYELELPSTGQKIKYRPFVVKEEKILLLALESEDIKEITNAMKAIISNCIETKGIKVEKLPSFDIEYIFLNIRKKSVGEEIELNIICPDDEKTEVKVTIDIDDIKVYKDPNHTNKIELDDGLILEFRYPSLDQFIRNNFNPDTITIDQSFDLIIDSIEALYDNETVYTHADYTKEEWNEFLESVVTAKFIKIQEFFDTMPKLTHTLEVINPKTKVKSEVKLEGLGAFFTSQ